MCEPVKEVLHINRIPLSLGEGGGFTINKKRVALSERASHIDVSPKGMNRKQSIQPLILFRRERGKMKDRQLDHLTGECWRAFRHKGRVRP